MAPCILIVDDEPSIRKVLSAQLRRAGHEVMTAPDGSEAIVRLQEHDFRLVISDLKMPTVDGMALLRWTTEHRPGLPLVLITAHGTIDTAVEALKNGAFDYITKPFDQDELAACITKALATERKNATRVQPTSDGKFDIVGSTPAMREVFRLIERVAPSPTTALVIGESGTGKELVARALHNQSNRADGTFVQINCGAIPDQLFEAELFGYERGAFTGAATSKPGRFELAHEGTLFLDEVGELPKDMQVKLLRALQERRIDRVGGLQPIEVDVRVIAATNVNLEEAVAAGTFRQDLFYRLNVVPLHLPPLRERSGDIPALVRHFLHKFNLRLGKEVQEVSPEALAALMEHPWPGNIRQLENAMERSVLLSDGPRIELHDLPGTPPSGEQAHVADPSEELGLKEYVRAHTVKLERAKIAAVLEVEEGNVTRAAKRLGISRKSLQLKMRDYGLRG